MTVSRMKASKRFGLTTRPYMITFIEVEFDNRESLQSIKLDIIEKQHTYFKLCSHMKKSLIITQIMIAVFAISSCVSQRATKNHENYDPVYPVKTGSRNNIAL